MDAEEERKHEDTLRAVAVIFHTELLRVCDNMEAHNKRTASIHRALALTTVLAVALALIGVNDAWVLPFTLGAGSYALLRQ